MKINQTSGSNGVSGVKPSLKRPADAAAARDTAPAQADDLHLSNAAGQLQQLEAQVGALPEIDMGRVNAIRQAISEGRLQINPEAIADGVLNTVRDVLSNKGGQS